MEPQKSGIQAPRRLFLWICAGCGLGGLILMVLAPMYLQVAAPVRLAELGFARTIADWGRKSVVRDDLVFVGLDDVSANLLEQGGLEEDEIAASEALELIAFGKPFPRGVWAQLGERLLEAGARVVVFDILFAHQTPEDAELKALLDRYPERVVIGGEFFGQREVESGSTWAFKMPASSVLSPGGEKDPRLGSVTFVTREDQRIWDATFSMRVEEHPGAPSYRSLAARALEQIGEADKVPDRREAGIRFSEMDAANAYEPLPLYTLFFEKTWDKNYGRGAFFKDKIVVVGGASNVEDDRDESLTPAGTMRGPQVHMTVIANALNGEFFRWAPVWLNGFTVLLGAVGAFCVAWLSGGPVRGVLVLFGLVALYLTGAVLAFNAGIMLNGAAPLATLLLAGSLCFGVQFAMERRDKLRLKRALDRYVSREISDEILARPDEFMESLGGRRITATVLFSDLRGFTAKSEKVDERELVAQLNEYLNAMVDCVFAHGGMVDKFIGDAVMAVWGAVRHDGLSADARGAVSAALEMRQRLAELNRKWAVQGRQTHAFGIGINQGRVVFGNIGSLAKMELTVIGDAVNLASRLEGLTKVFGVDLLVSAAVSRHLDKDWALRPIDRVVPSGKTEAVEISTVLAHGKDELDAGEREFLDCAIAANAAWREADPERAERLLRECLALRPDDRTTKLYLDRLAESGGDPTKMREAFRVTQK